MVNKSAVSPGKSIELTDEEILLFKNLLLNITAIPSQDPNEFCKQTKQASLFVPDRIRKILMDFAKHGSKTGYLLIKNVPIDKNEIPETPKNNNYQIGEKLEISRIQAILLNVVGEIIAYEAECNGHLFQDIVPNKLMAQNQTSLGSNIELEIHTEQAFSKLRPDILSLSCVRGDINAFTHILPVHTILNNVTENERKLLETPLWKTGVDLSFKLNGHEFIEGDVRGPIPIINGTQNDPILIFDQDLMTGITEEANNLLKKIIDIYYKNKLRHNLKPGEIMLVDNKRAVHGRSQFFPKYDGKDRFLVRCFAVFDYKSTKYARPNDGRIIKAIYS